MPDELVNVRYMVDDVEAAVAFYTDALRLHGAHQRRARVRRRRARQPAAAAQRADELGRAADARRPHARAGRLEPHPPHRRRHRGRGRAAARRRPDVPQRHRDGPGGHRSCSRIPPATRSSCSSRPEPDHPAASERRAECVSPASWLGSSSEPSTSAARTRDAEDERHRGDRADDARRRAAVDAGPVHRRRGPCRGRSASG